MDTLFPFVQASGLLPIELRQVVLAVPKRDQMVTEEIRLRIGHPISITLPQGEMILRGSPIIASRDLYTVLEVATKSSAHTALEQVRQGYVTVRGGHRLGLCGSMISKDGNIHNMRHLMSLNIRIARQISGIGNELLQTVCNRESIASVLVMAPPGAGKTTLLRDMIRGLSVGICGRPFRVGVADERGELGAMWEGVPQFDLGPHTDVLEGCSKCDGLLMLLRGMNPQVLAVDEITAPQDIEALQIASGCGVSLLATAHGRTREDLNTRPLYAMLLQKNIFQKLIRIAMIDGVRSYVTEDITC